MSLKYIDNLYSTKYTYKLNVGSKCIACKQLILYFTCFQIIWKAYKHDNIIKKKKNREMVNY